MGEDEISEQVHQNVREGLERELDSLQVAMKQLNEANKPPRKKKWYQKVPREIGRIVRQVNITYESQSENDGQNQGSKTCY